MTTYHDLTGFRRDILEAIAHSGDNPHGLAIKEWLAEHYSDHIHGSRLYQNLNHLTDDGLVNRTEIGDRTNAYTLTDEGKQLLQYHIVDLTDGQAAENNDTLT